jgi:hypothetical protein
MTAIQVSLQDIARAFRHLVEWVEYHSAGATEPSGVRRE